MRPTPAPEWKIADIVKEYPAAREVFRQHGLDQLVNEDGLRVLSPFLTLGTALRSRRIPVSVFMEQLEKAIGLDHPVEVEAPGLSDIGKQGDLTLLALMPCGLKMPFSRAISAFLTQLRERDGLAVTYAVEGNLNQELSYYSYVEQIRDIDELPDIIVSADFNTFYGRSFYQRFVATGQLCGYPGTGSAVNHAYRQAGIATPDNGYTVLAVNPLVIVANLDELGDRELPTGWHDLLEPRWQRSVTLRGGGDFFCHAVLLPTYQRYGAAGLTRLGRNVLQGLHPAQMVKQIDTGRPGALYVMPEFFAHRAIHKERIQIIWPTDGALASPVTLQVKSTKIEQLRPILDYLTGQELARILVGARFPVPHGDVEGEVQGKPLWWLGWDYLASADLLARNREIDAIFMPLVAGR
ncbi:MAG: ABC transporter substrate-binding protein [Desulfopila sp.]